MYFMRKIFKIIAIIPKISLIFCNFIHTTLNQGNDKKSNTRLQKIKKESIKESEILDDFRFFRF